MGCHKDSVETVLALRGYGFDSTRNDLMGEQEWWIKKSFHVVGMNLRIGLDNKSMAVFPGKYAP